MSSGESEILAENIEMSSGESEILAENRNV